MGCPHGWGVPMDGVSPWMGCPHGWGVPMDGVSPRQRHQTLTSLIQEDVLHLKQDKCWGGFSMLGGSETPHPILCPPGPTATHLHISVHDAQVVEVHWGEDRAIRVVGTLPAWCLLPPPWHPAGSIPPLGMADPACRSPLVGTVVAVPDMAGHSPSTSTSSAANRRTVASAKHPAARHSA